MDAKTMISDEQKIYELSRIWKDAEYNFAYWDKVNIDWDEAYKNAIPISGMAMRMRAAMRP